MGSCPDTNIDPERHAELSHYSKINFIACDFSILYVKKERKVWLNIRCPCLAVRKKWFFPPFWFLTASCLEVLITQRIAHAQKLQ